MLERARVALPEVVWQQDDLATWTPAAPVDMLVSNAALHWLDDHATLFPRLLSHLRPGGMLAVQMPAQFAAPSHQIGFDLAKARAGATACRGSCAAGRFSMRRNIMRCFDRGYRHWSCGLPSMFRCSAAKIRWLNSQGVVRRRVAFGAIGHRSARFRGRLPPPGRGRLSTWRGWRDVVSVPPLLSAGTALDALQCSFLHPARDQEEGKRVNPSALHSSLPTP